MEGDGIVAAAAGDEPLPPRTTADADVVDIGESCVVEDECEGEDMPPPPPFE